MCGVHGTPLPPLWRCRPLHGGLGLLLKECCHLHWLVSIPATMLYSHLKLPYMCTSFPEPDFEYLHALAPYQPLHMKVWLTASLIINFRQLSFYLLSLLPSGLLLSSRPTTKLLCGQQTLERTIGKLGLHCLDQIGSFLAQKLWYILCCVYMYSLSALWLLKAISPHQHTYKRRMSVCNRLSNYYAIMWLSCDV